ncbi:type I-E CRISPR-associated protein Cas6/Cse3/CasE [Streptomyces sp. 796.1]|uniref:type I-E CRISPR-associated protein Cas6/Cse3/CasE n=1 Tax=Streptomyces sp. 796.1 TaxID=3163029 RepID=UPI0039C9D3D6
MTYLSRVRINPLRAESRRLLANPRALHGAVQGGLPGASDERVLWRLDADDPRRPHLVVLTRSRPDWTHVVERAGWPDADGEHALVRDYTPLLDRIAVGQEYAFRLTANPVQNTIDPVKPTPRQARRLAELPPDRKPRGFRLAHRTAAAQLNWFLTRTARWGFEVPAARTDPTAPGLPGPAGPTGLPDLANPADPSDPSDRASAAVGGTPAPRTTIAHEVRITARHRHSFRKGGRNGGQASPADQAGGADQAGRGGSGGKGGRGTQVTFHSATFEGHLRVTDPEALTAHLLGGIGPAKAYGCGLLTLAPLPAAR